MTVWDYLIQGIPKDQIFETEESVIIYLSFSWDKDYRIRVSMKDMAYDDPYDDVISLIRNYKGPEATDILVITNEKVKRMKSCTINQPEDSKLSEYSLYARRPFYMVRGKTITVEQVKEIIKGELPIFRDKDLFDDKSDSQYMNSCVLGDLLTGMNGGGGGWLWDSGEIGGNRWIYELR